MTIIMESFKMSTRKKIEYVNNQDLFEALVKYSAVRSETPDDPPRVPNYIAECIMKIATHLAYRPNFSNYTFRDEMISDGIENALSAVKTFDPLKSERPFAYFTQVIWWAFVRRIQIEKKYLYTKYAVSRRAELLDMTSDSQGVEGEDRHAGSLMYGEWSKEQMDKFMDDFEKRVAERKKGKKIDKRKKTV